MEEPSLSELEQMAGYLQRRLTALKIEAPAEKVTLSGNIIPAGSIFYCRPSRLRELVERLGGEENVQIMDSAATRGFCRGKDKPALPWTNEVYPTDIGPSCAGIDSDTARISVATTNNCITPTDWDPVKLFQAGTERFSFDYYTNCDSVMRVLLIHGPGLTKEKFQASGTYQLACLPSLIKPSGFQFKALEESLSVALFTTRGTEETWSEDDISFMIGKVPSIADLLKIKDLPIPTYDEKDFFKLFPDEELCMVEWLSNFNGDEENDPEFVSTMNLSIPSPLLPFRLKIFKINSNEIDNGTATPEIRYGGYDRKTPPGSGPPPAWGRTYVVQIKTLHDVAVTFRAPDEDASAGGNDN